MSQKTQAVLNTEIDTDLATNGANAITAAVLRPVLKDMVDSAANLADGQTLYSGDGTLAGDRSVDANSKALQITNATDITLAAKHNTTSGDAQAELFEGGVELKVNGGSGGLNGNLFVDKTGVQVAGGSQVIDVDQTGIKVGTSSSQLVAFLGATPIPRTANANQAVATDPTSTQTLANALRQEMIDRGFWKGSA